MDEKSATYTSLMDEGGRDHLHWWIVFEKGNCDHWWTKLFDQDMRHCWAVKFDGEHFIAFRPYIGYTDIEILPIKDSRHIAPDATAVLSVHTTADGLQMRDLVPACFNCVEQVKALLGVKAWGIVTPRQLYNHLINTPTITTIGH